MSMNNVLLLIGSPKRSASTSESLGSYLEQGLRSKGLTVNKLHLKKVMGVNNSTQEVLAAIDDSETIIFAVPLYVDTMPAHVTRMMEAMHEHHRQGGSNKNKKLLAIVNCGMPDPMHNSTAIGIFHRFADLSGFEWAGGLSLGGGSIIDGKPLGTLGNDVKSVKRSLDLTASALADGKPVPEEALKLMSQPLIPPFIPKIIVAWIGNMGFKKTAKENGVLNKFLDRPYEQA
jgi:hypothetical protein